MLDISEEAASYARRTMTTFSDFIENIPATEAMAFYNREEHILRETFGDIEFYRRRDLCMMAARRRRKLILDVHWLNRCLKTPYIEC